MKKFSEFMNEKLITFGGKRPKFNQIVIMAGGAGSGKGFVQKKLLGIDGRVLDVDAVKEMLIKSTKYAEKVRREFNVDVSQLDLGNQEDVSKLHAIEKSLQISNKKLKYLFKTASNTPAFKPNIIFDVTMKDIKKLAEISESVQKLGYRKEDIHVVWVINDIEVARQQNAKRTRKVADSILLNTHQGVSATVSSILHNGDAKAFMDGDFWLVFNKKFSDSVIAFNDDNTGSYVKEVVYTKIKERKGNIMNVNDIADKYLERIKKYVPNSDVWESFMLEGYFMADKGEPAKMLDKFITTFWKQNKWHKHGVFMHTLNVVISAIKSGDYKMIPAAFLHDIGKPALATRDDDKPELSYSFKGHEEASYEMIKNWKFVSKYTKELVRWHYLIRGKSKAKEKYKKTGDESFLKEYERQKGIWDSLDKQVQKDLQRFLKHDDAGKDWKSLFKKYK